jgi:ankyrin repeat protein
MTGVTIGANLHMAAINNQNEVVKNALRQNSSLVNQQEVLAGDSFLHIVAAKGNKHLAAFLLEMGACAELTNKAGETPARTARAQGNDELADLIESHVIM